MRLYMVDDPEMSEAEATISEEISHGLLLAGGRRTFPGIGAARG